MKMGVNHFLAVGYPNWDFPPNAVLTSRESLENNTRRVGF
jgi:hypothetical protein